MLRKIARLASLLAFFLALLIPSIALATCAPGKMDYGDIEAVRYTGDGCAAVGSAGRSGQSNCGSYWIFFWSILPDVTFDQYGRIGSGDYRIRGSVLDADAILKKHAFFDEVPKSWLVTDTPQPSISVLRCGIVTRLAAYDTDGENPEILAMFRDFEAFAARGAKRRVTMKPVRFKYSLFGDFDDPFNMSTLRE